MKIQLKIIIYLPFCKVLNACKLTEGLFYEFENSNEVMSIAVQKFLFHICFFLYVYSVCIQVYLNSCRTGALLNFALILLAYFSCSSVPSAKEVHV